MNKNDKFHGAEHAINAQSISDDELETVSGGIECPATKLGKYCPTCGRWLYNADYENHVAACSKAFG